MKAVKSILMIAFLSPMPLLAEEEWNLPCPEGGFADPFHLERPYYMRSIGSGVRDSQQLTFSI